MRLRKKAQYCQTCGRYSSMITSITFFILQTRKTKTYFVCSEFNFVHNKTFWMRRGKFKANVANICQFYQQFWDREGAAKADTADQILRWLGRRVGSNQPMRGEHGGHWPIGGGCAEDCYLWDVELFRGGEWVRVESFGKRWKVATCKAAECCKLQTEFPRIVTN